MLDLLDIATWIAVGKIIIVDIVLAGDNAVVIGMAAEKLSPDLQKKAIFWGTFGAIAIRLVLAFLLAEALHIIPALHIIGGIVLAWIAVKLLMDQDEEAHVEAKDSLREAIITIVLADAMMSIDNVIGVVAAAQGIMELVVLGMLVTVPIIIFSASLFAKLISKYPIILYAGGAVLGWVAGEMVVADPLLA
ncbi:TerC family protein, partial [uncultured Veillonella sp.]